MGRRKSRARPPRKQKIQKLDVEFDCPYCFNLKSVHYKLNVKLKIGEMWCTLCSNKYTSPSVNHLTECIDLYSQWVDTIQNDSTSKKKPILNREFEKTPGTNNEIRGEDT